jgi:pimeloyl-ACP methyl ester carboxylesterase
VTSRTATIDGLRIAYEVIGQGGGLPRPFVITPGGRFSKDTPGVRQLAEALAAEGGQVVIWDRPNTGESDVFFGGSSESQVQADALAGLLRHLGLAPAVVFGGSGGARVSLLAAASHPDVAERLALVWVSGGVYGLINLAPVYCGEPIRAAWSGGMEAVVALPMFEEVLARNPRNRERFLALDPRELIAHLERWMLVYVPRDDALVPGLPDERARALAVPTLIFRSGASDPHHPRETTERLHALIPGSELVEPPWPDDEWNRRSAASAAGTGHLFERWPLLAPQLLEWARRGA